MTSRDRLQGSVGSDLSLDGWRLFGGVILKIRAVIESPRNAFLPASISYRMQPAEKRSLRPVADSAARLLGAHVRGRAQRTARHGQVLARFDGPGDAEVGDLDAGSPASIITLAGLMSRCTTLCAMA